MNFQECVNRLEKIVEKCEESNFKEYKKCEISWSDVQAISVVLGNLDAAFDMYSSAERDLKRQKQINKEHKKINGELREKIKELEKENKNYNIAYNLGKAFSNKNWEQKIKDKVKELKQIIERTKNDDQYSHEIPLYEHDIQILEELLKESEMK